MSGNTPPAQAAAPAMTHRETLEALSGIILGMLVALLAATIVSSSMPLIVADLGGSQSAYTWVVTATLLAQTVSTPLWGKFADLFNRKLLVQIALVITVVSAAAAGFSHSMGQLIAFRGLQGLGAGGLMALATVLVADIVSPRERGRYMGLIGGFMAVAQVGGPLLGGVLTDSIGWRWNFFIGIPFAIAAILVLQKTLHLPTLPRRIAKIDYWGAILISVGVSVLLLWVTFAAAGNYAWMSWQTFVMVGVAVASLVGAVLVERVVSEPVIPLDLFRNRTFVLAVVASISVGVAMFGTAVFLSQYLQISRGKTPTESALLTIPMVAGTMIAGIVLGRIISATGRYKAIMVGGGVLLIASLLGMGTIDAYT
jgi:EmrB/QacA subfamily drug resistance transporter